MAVEIGRSTRGSSSWRNRAWWMTIGSEEAPILERCPVETCTATIGSLDLYCTDREHSEFLLLCDHPSRRARLWALAVTCGVIGVLVTMAADRQSIWPVYVLPVVTGCLLIGLPLRAHRIGRSVGLALWLSAAVSVAAFALFSDEPAAARVIWTLALVVPLAALATIAVSGVAEMDREGDFEGLGLLAMPTIAAVILAAAWWSTTGSLSNHLVGVPDTASRWLLYAALCGVLASSLMSMLAALTLSFGDMNTSVNNPLRTPRIASVGWRYAGRPIQPPRRRSFDALLAWRLMLLGHRLRQVLVDFARRTVNVFLVIVGTLQRLLCRLLNWLYRRVRLACRRVAYVVTTGSVTLVVVLSMAVAALSRGQRTIVAYVAAIGGAIAARHVAEDLTLYLVDGPLSSLADIALWSLIGVAACIVVTERLSREKTRPAVQSQLRFLENASPNLAILVVVLGWMIGLVGTFWHGPVGIGWVTGTGTAVLIAMATPTWLGMAHEAPDNTAAALGSDPRGLG